MWKQGLVIGVLVLSPWVALAASTNHDGAAHAPAAWASMDANSDDVLSRQEVATTPWADRFDQMDRDDDSQVTKQEYAAYRQDMKDESANKPDKQ